MRSDGVLVLKAVGLGTSGAITATGGSEAAVEFIYRFGCSDSACKTFLNSVRTWWEFCDENG